MSKAKRVLMGYVGDCLEKGIPFKKIEQMLIGKGYDKKVAEGVILRYRHRGKLLKWFMISLLFITLSFSLYFGGQSITGMASLDYGQRYSLDLNLVFNESSKYTIWVGEGAELVSLSISGNMFGNSAKVYLLSDSVKYLVMDSNVDNSRISLVKSQFVDKEVKHFEGVCEGSCSLPDLDQDTYELSIELDNAQLELTELQYTLKVGAEALSVPYFVRIPDQQMTVGKTLSVDLSSFFNTSIDSTYSAIFDSSELEIGVEGDIATITSKREGVTKVFFVADIAGTNFVSNAVEVQSYHEFLSTPEIVLGPVSYNDNSTQDLEQIDNDGYIIFFTIFLGMCILLLFFVPARKFSMQKLSKKIGKIRGDEDFSNSVEEYEKEKSRLDKVDESKKEETLKNLSKKLSKVSRKLIYSKNFKAFALKTKEFDRAKTKKSKEKHYQAMKKLYDKCLEDKIPAKKKKELYLEMQKYYKKISR